MINSQLFQQIFSVLKIRNKVLADLFAAVVIGGYVLLSGGPISWCDDYFFIGSGIHFAQTGELRNPFLSSLFLTASGFTSDAFHYHPPLHTFLVGNWCRIFGISEFSICSLYALTYSIGAFCFARLIARVRVAFLPRVAVMIVFVLSMQPIGFRSEGVAYSFLAAGILLSTSLRSWAVLSGWLLIGFSILTYPSTFGPALVVGASVVFGVFPGPCFAPRNFSFRQLILGGVGAAAVFIILWVMLDGKIGEFWNTYNQMAKLANPSTMGDPDRFVRFFQLTTSYNQVFLTFPLFLVLSIGAVLAIVPGSVSRLQPQQRWMLLILLLTVLASIAMAHLRTKQWMLACGFASVGIVCSQYFTGRMARLLTGVLLIAWAGGSQIFSIITLSLQNPVDPNLASAIRDYVHNSGKNLLIDGQTARYIYDFRIPEGTIDITWHRGNVFTEEVNIDLQRSNEIWLATRGGDVGLPDLKQEPLKIGSLIISNVYQSQCDPWIIEDKIIRRAKDILLPGNQ